MLKAPVTVQQGYCCRGWNPIPEWNISNHQSEGALCHARRASSFFLPSCKYANATVAAAAVYLPSHSISAALLLLLFWALLLFFCSVCGILGGLGGCLLGLGGRTSLISGPFPHISLSLSGRIKGSQLSLSFSCSITIFQRHQHHMGSLGIRTEQRKVAEEVQPVFWTGLDK